MRWLAPSACSSISSADLACSLLALGAVADQPGQIELDGSERAADTIVNRPRDIGTLLLDAGVQVFGQLGQALFGLGQLQCGAAAGSPRLMDLHGALDDMGQAVDLVLEEENADASSRMMSHGGGSPIAPDSSTKGGASARSHTRS